MGCNHAGAAHAADVSGAGVADCACAGDDSSIRLWDAATGRPVHEMKGHVGANYAVAFSPDGRMLASGGSGGTVRLWDARTGDNLAILRDRSAGLAKNETVFAVQFTPDGDHLLVGGEGGYLGLWDLRHYDRHLAGNLGYWADHLEQVGRPRPIAGAGRSGASTHLRMGGRPNDLGDPRPGQVERRRHHPVPRRDRSGDAARYEGSTECRRRSEPGARGGPGPRGRPDTPPPPPERPGWASNGACSPLSLGFLPHRVIAVASYIPSEL